VNHETRDACKRHKPYFLSLENPPLRRNFSTSILKRRIIYTVHSIFVMFSGSQYICDVLHYLSAEVLTFTEDKKNVRISQVTTGKTAAILETNIQGRYHTISVSSICQSLIVRS
jgi:hypothetical protein